jgi:hypothetical protein
MTQSNVFDVHVFLTNDNDYSNPIDTTGLLLVENIGTLTGLNYSSGPMTFNLPAGVGINDYQHIVFICVRFGQLHWGDGEFSESSVITNTTELDGLERLAVDIYPNPSGTDLVNVKLENPQTNTLLEVMSLEGKVVLREYVVGTQPYSVELKDPRTYFFKLTSDVSSVVRKIIRL